MPKKYRPKIKGYVLPYIYSDSKNPKPLLLVAMEKLKEPGEYYCTLLGGTSKNLREIKDSTVRELCEETRGYMQVDKSNLLEYMTLNDRDRCTIYLLPLANNYKIIHDINAFKNGVLMPPECAESSFIIALSIEELLLYAKNTEPSSAPYYYFRKPFVNKYPLTSYRKFIDYCNNGVPEYRSNVQNEFSVEFDNVNEDIDKQTHEQELNALKENLFALSRKSSKSSSSGNGSSQESQSPESSSELSEMSDEDRSDPSDISDEIPLNLEGLENSLLIRDINKCNKTQSSLFSNHDNSSKNTLISPKSAAGCPFLKEDIKNYGPKVWVGERLSRVLHNLDTNLLEKEHLKHALFYKYVDRNICDCRIKPPKQKTLKMHSI